jgi:DNA-binding MarR family transcriptional regulator
MSQRKPASKTADASSLAAELHGLVGKLKRKLREQASAGDLTPSQSAVLRHLGRDGPTTVTALAKMEGVRPQSMGATVAGLEALGLIKGAPDAKDGRQTILSLTPSCREMIRTGRAARQEWLLKAIQSKLSTDEQAQLAFSLRLLGRIVDDETGGSE